MHNQLPEGVPESAAFTSATFNPINVSLLPFDSILLITGGVSDCF